MAIQTSSPRYVVLRPLSFDYPDAALDPVVDRVSETARNAGFPCDHIGKATSKIYALGYYRATQLLYSSMGIQDRIACRVLGRTLAETDLDIPRGLQPDFSRLFDANQYDQYRAVQHAPLRLRRWMLMGLHVDPDWSGFYPGIATTIWRDTYSKQWLDNYITEYITNHFASGVNEEPSDEPNLYMAALTQGHYYSPLQARFQAIIRLHDVQSTDMTA
ncbi:hypothetical protein IWQ60_001489 [Tieghemiomyces parasiticus]|uniref:Uncharacterized protein n=1 Tax=Tieghemiomyces parasiticus TaxID=78921 RepID=A0A9W8AKM2_9FUNG|nr:hypothetical protein IWQ60_001489 [Tieghemiomyces parasiticus]